MSTNKTSTFRKVGKIFLRLIGWTSLAGLMLGIGVLAGTAYVVANAMEKIPSYQEMRAIPSGTTIRYFSSDGVLLHSVGPAYGEWVEYKDIPVEMRQAIVAVEDRRFRQHIGIDPIAIVRAVKFAWDNRGNGRRLQGASTITQQVARTLFLDRSYDFRRKIDEMIMALAMEQKLSKDQILELYLNKAYFGGGAYGIDAASRTFYNHDSSSLDLQESALLAGLVKAPSDYSPTADPKAAEARMKTVLRLIKETGQNQSADPAAEMPKLEITKDVTGRTGSRHFIDWVEPQIDQYLPGLTGQIDVHTTLDSKFQEEALSASDRLTPSDAQSAIVTIENNGAIRAMVGGRDYATSTYNRATQAQRQPGSAFKLFVYLTAIESGYGPQSRVFDGPITIAGWSPQNSSGRYSGNLALKTAFAYSLNTVAARLGQRVGTERIAQMAHRLGISTPINTDPSMVLGTMDVRLLDMTRAYAIISNSGLSVVPYGIEKIEQSGKLVYQRTKDARQIMVSQNTAAIMTSLMRGVVEGGTAGAAQIGRPVAGKTGTTSFNKDGWFIGFSSGLTTGVWVGRDDAKAIPGLEGGRAPARIFSDYMKEAVKGRNSGFETIEPPKINGIDMTSEGLPRGAAAVPAAANQPIPETSIQKQVIPPPPPPSKEGKSRAIRPDDN